MLEMFENSTQYKNTKNLLNLISEHLSSREDCRKLDYYVEIFPYDSRDKIEQVCFIMRRNGQLYTPYVFPDRYHRKQLDKLSILKHIFNYHFNDIHQYCSNQPYRVIIDQNNFIPGCYAFKAVGSSQRRQWSKIR